MAGGVALNCVMNARIRDRGPFKQCLGAAGRRAMPARRSARRSGSTRRSGAPRRRSYCMDHAFLGPEYTEEEIESFLRWSKLPYRRLDDRGRGNGRAARPGQDHRLVPGPPRVRPPCAGRALDPGLPDQPDMQARLNEIKDREDFRPVAPVVLEEEAANWFTGRRPVALHAVCLRRAAREGRQDPGRAPRRRHRPYPDDQPGQNAAILRSAQGVSARGPACRSWSIRRSTPAASRSCCHHAMRSSASGPRRSTRW